MSPARLTPPTPTTIYLVRHAQSEHNVAWDNELSLRHTSSLGTGLTPLGVAQARMLAQRLRAIPIHALYSSPLLRAQQTATIIATAKRLPVSITDSLREHYLGALERQTDTAVLLRTFKRIERLQRSLPDREKLRIKLVEDMESEEEAASRMRRYLKRIARQHQGKTLLVVSHGVIIRSFLIQLGFAPYYALRHPALTNGAYVRLLATPQHFVVEETYGVHLTH